MLEAIEIDEDDRERLVVAAMTLHLAPPDLVEEPAVVAAGQRIGDRHLLDLLVGRRERQIRAVDLVRHVLEDEQMHAERDEDGRDDVEREEDVDVRGVPVEPVGHHGAGAVEDGKSNVEAAKNAVLLRLTPTVGSAACLPT